MNSPIHTHVFTNRQTQRGLSLVELMISITIGLLILSSLTTLFVNQSRTRAELDKSNRMIDNGRYALELLSDNLKLAGFYGNYTPSGTPADTPDPCNLSIIINNTVNNPDPNLYPSTNAQANRYVLLHHVQGYNAATATPPSTGQIASLPATCGFTYTAGSPTTLKDGSDMLVLRRASTATVAAANATAAPNSANTVYLQVSNCSTDTSGSYQIAIGSAAFTAFQNKDCATPASLRPFIVQVYFVSPDNNVGDGIPTLKRRELDAATGAFVTTPLVEGIEYLQIDYGLDTNADGAADAYCDFTSTTAPCHLFTAADWPNIVSVKLNIIARNTEPTTGYIDTKTYALGSAGAFGPFGDAYKRHAYTQVVRLVNPSGRREVP